MRLRSLTKHIREQNWFAVALDFFIVVVGILIAFQITNWNEARLNKSEERVYLERLKGDLVQSLAELKSDTVDINEWRREGRMLLLALLTENEAALPQDPCWAISLSSRTFVASPQMATIKELIAGGRTNLITNKALREGLVRYEAEIESLQALNDVISNRMDAVSPILATRSRVVVNGENPIDSPIFECGIQFDVLARDEEFRNILRYARELQRNNIYFYDLMIEESEATLALVNREIEGRGQKLEETP